MKSFLSLPEYERFIYTLQETYPAILRSTVVMIRRGQLIAEVSGELSFADDYRLSLFERLRWNTGQLTLAGYSYEVWRGDEKLYWYDSQAHPNDPTLASTDPHHKHIPPDIKHHRIPAPGLSFAPPNLPFLIQEIEGMTNCCG